MTCESCRAVYEENKLLKEENKLLREQNRLLKQNNQLLKKYNEQLEGQIKEIKSYIWKPKRQATRPKKIGPPENHKPHNRPIPKKIHRKQRLSLVKCPDCGKELSKPVRTRKRYVEDIRPPEPMNTEYEIPYYYCKNCKKQVSPKPADVIPKCRFGISLMLLITFLRYAMLLPLNKIARELEVVYGIEMSEGCIVDSITRFAGYLGPEFENIKQEVKELAVVHMDETGWRINGENTWLWDFITKRHALFAIDKNRSSDVPKKILGNNPDRIAVCDCYSAYDKFGGKQQKCWVHILRNSKKFGKEGGILHYKLKSIYRKAKRYAGRTMPIL